MSLNERIKNPDEGTFNAGWDACRAYQMDPVTAPNRTDAFIEHVRVRFLETIKMLEKEEILRKEGVKPDLDVKPPEFDAFKEGYDTKAGKPQAPPNIYLKESDEVGKKHPPEEKK